jgi:hypothetical protein
MPYLINDCGYLNRRQVGGEPDAVSTELIVMFYPLDAGNLSRETN